MLIQAPHSWNSLAHACSELPFFSLQIKRRREDFLSKECAFASLAPRHTSKMRLLLPPAAPMAGEWACPKKGAVGNRALSIPGTK